MERRVARTQRNVVSIVLQKPVPIIAIFYDRRVCVRPLNKRGKQSGKKIDLFTNAFKAETNKNFFLIFHFYFLTGRTVIMTLSIEQY